MIVRKLTTNIGAELSGVNLGDASRDAGLFAEIKSLLLAHRVLFLRDQDITRAEHVAFARRFGELEDHPVAGSDPDHPGLVRIYRSEQKNPYENNWHVDGLWRPNPAMGCVLRCIERPETGGTPSGSTWSRRIGSCPRTSSAASTACAPRAASSTPSAR